MFRSKVPDATVIGSGTLIEGVVQASGRVQVDGRVEGTLVVDGEVSVGPDGCINGELVGTTVVIGGTVTGKLVVERHLHLISTAVVQGDVRYETLQVDRGGVIGGTANRAEERPSGELVRLEEDPELPSAAAF